MAAPKQPDKSQETWKISQKYFSSCFDYLRSVVTDLNLKQYEFVFCLKFLSCTQNEAIERGLIKVESKEAAIKANNKFIEILQDEGIRMSVRAIVTGIARGIAKYLM